MIPRSSKKIPAEYGMKDYYKYYSKNYSYKVKKGIYNDIVTELNKFIVDEIVETSKEFSLPHRSGYIGVVKKKRGVKILPGDVVINSSPPDWKATKDLWAIDEEAKAKKIIVKYKNTHTAGYVYSIRYSKYNATFQNKHFMLFTATRDFKRAIAKRINDYSKEKYNAHEIRI